MVCMKAIEYYDTDFGTVRLNGFGNYLLPVKKPDYRRERELYRNWKGRAGERAAFEVAVNNFCEQVWKMGRVVKEIVVE